MSDATGRYELTTSLSIEGGTPERLDDYVRRFDEALVAVLRPAPGVTAYFANADPDAFEIRVGLRFEGIPAKNIERLASQLIDEAIAIASESADAAGPSPVREESTLVPA